MPSMFEYSESLEVFPVSFFSDKKLYIFRNITISKFFLVEIYCPFVMHYYPFDRQSCEILIVNRGIVKDNVQLIAEKLTYNGPEDYLEYFIQEPTFTTDENNTLRVKMILKRRILNVASNTFLPVILIVLVSLSQCARKGYGHGNF